MTISQTLSLLILGTSVAACAASKSSSTTAPAAPATPPTTIATTEPAATAVNRFESEIAAFEAADRVSPPPRESVLFWGSSSFRFWTTLQSDFPTLPVVNRGFGGSEMSDCVHFLDRAVLPLKPRTILIYAGDNDLASGKSPDEIVEVFKTLVARTHAALPLTKIAYVSIKPSPSRWHLRAKADDANNGIRRFAESDPQRLLYIDIVAPMLGTDGQPRPELYVADKLHMTPAGYVIWKDVVGEALKTFDAR